MLPRYHGYSDSEDDEDGDDDEEEGEEADTRSREPSNSAALPSL